MRLHLVSGHGFVSGGEQMLLRMALAARNSGHDVVVVGPAWGELAVLCEGQGLAYRDLPGGSRRRYARSMAGYFTRRHAGLLWANGGLPALGASLSMTPFVVHLHQIPSTRQAVSLRVARRRARATVVPSMSLAARIPGSIPLLNWTQELQPRDEVPSPEAFEIAYIGRLSLDKGIDVLAEAVARVTRSLASRRRVRLLLAGDERFVPADQQRRVQEALADSALDVERLGWVDPRTVYSRATVCVVPSRTFEAFGLVVAEAMAMRAPVVVSDAGALPEVAGHEHPWVFESGSASALAELLGGLAGGIPAEPVDRARDRWEQHFSPRAGAARFEALLRGL